MTAPKAAHHEAHTASSAAPERASVSVANAKGYTTDERLGQPYHTAADGYSSFDESYVREHVAAMRQIEAAQAAVTPAK